MWPRNFVGEGTVAEDGRSATQGEANRGSVVAAAIASREPGSGESKPSAPLPAERPRRTPATDAAHRALFMSGAF